VPSSAYAKDTLTRPRFLTVRSAIPNTNNDGTDGHADEAENATAKSKSGRKKKNGQNTNRSFGSSRDAIQLCSSRQKTAEFSPGECRFNNCRYEHDLRKYLKDGKRKDLDTFNGICPIFAARGKCPHGWSCRFASSHSTERTLEDGRKELVLVEEPRGSEHGTDDGEARFGVVNVVPQQAKTNLQKKITKTPQAERYTEFLNKLAKDGTGEEREGQERKRENVVTEADTKDDAGESDGGVKLKDDDVKKEDDQIKIEDQSNGADGANIARNSRKDNRAQYIEPPFLPSEKRRLYYGPETPVLAPLTTQGNLPFRRLCVSLGAQVTWSEMAMGIPLLQGERSEWALLKAHESELAAPKYEPSTPLSNYDNASDIRFGAQIAANKPWLALKTAEVLANHLPHLRAIDLNAGCPIDLVYRQGAGSALLDRPAQLEKILRGMNAVSGSVPITVKIRSGTKDNHPTSERLVERLAFGGQESQDNGLGPAGVAAITLHGRSRQQRYTRSADWTYIASCAATIDRYRKTSAVLADTVREPDARLQSSNPLYFCGNGDCYSAADYYDSISNAGVDSVMVGRGALMKPWIFEEIAARQELDKSASERLEYIAQFCRYGLEAWGSDELGLGTTRRFLLEWLSFSCRYVPIGLLEYGTKPSLQDRPPAYQGRNELETLLASEDSRDWMKIANMYLGPPAEGFKFIPKHKSNSYEIEAEG